MKVRSKTSLEMNNYDVRDSTYFIHSGEAGYTCVCLVIYILPSQVRQADHRSALDNRCRPTPSCIQREGENNMYNNYDVTGLLTAVWKVITLMSSLLSCLMLV